MPNFVLIKHRTAVSAWIFLGIFICAGSAFADLSKVGRLNRTSAEIIRMNAAMHSKYSQAVDIRKQLGDMRDDLTGEIRRELEHRQPSDFAQAMKISRIEYNLELIRKLRACMVLLDRKIAYFHEGRQQLEFYNRRIQDDVMILNAVNHMAIDTLLHKIEQALHEYASAVDDVLLDAGEIAPEEIETTWKRVVTR